MTIKGTFAAPMKILILSKKFPFPLTEGEPIAISYLSRSLHDAGCSISLLFLNTSKHYFEISNFPKEENFFEEIFSVEVNNDINIYGALKSMLKGTSYMLSRFYSQEYAEQLKEVLIKNDFDIVQLETIYMAHYIPTIRKYTDAKVSIRAHNVEQVIWERVAYNSRFIFKKWYLNYQNKFLRAFELKKVNDCDLLVTITEDDLLTFKELGFRKEGISIPVGFHSNEYNTDYKPSLDQKSIAFIGALDWMPNQDGIVWFIENVWPDLIFEFPDLQLHIAGKNTPDWLKQFSSENILIHGQVPDAKSFITQHPILIAPLFSGSGIKIKVLEGLALGRVVVTTSVGVEGIKAENEKELLIADTAEQFISAIKRCFVDNTELLKIREAGRKHICEEFDAAYLADRLKKKYLNLINDSNKKRGFN
ncbi:MAG: glycosyltransferase family 4 protein [Bacteroidota bacterium]